MALSKLLPSDDDAKFKIKIRNAKNVVVLDGKRWNYLKNAGFSDCTVLPGDDDAIATPTAIPSGIL